MTARVLIIDDSVVARQSLARALGAQPDIDALRPAASGKLGLERIQGEPVDLVVLDVEMPEMDGLETLREIRSLAPKVPVVMFSALTERGAATTIEALASGASDYLAKPTTRAGEQRTFEDVTADLVRIIRGLVTGPTPKPAPASGPPAVAVPAAHAPDEPLELVVVGSSTGGPNALSQLFAQLPDSLDVPIVICQHMPREFTGQLAARLDRECGRHVVEATDGLSLRRREVCVARGGVHLVVERSLSGPVMRFDDRPQVQSCKPSVDVLFESAARQYRRRALGVVLTGMGQDGLEGSRAMVSQGARILVQDQESSVVWGMPGVVAQAGLASAVLPLGGLAEAVHTRAQAKGGRS
ncbi:MAG: chemotaxis-specific protein-glutamate methyltransferase CheB [Planctomycetota bacterium]